MGRSQTTPMRVGVNGKGFEFREQAKQMAHSLSAKKRIRQNIKHRALNRWRKVRFRKAITQFHETVLHGSDDDAATQLKDLYRLLDQVAAKGTIHKNTASRHKARLAARLNAKKAAAA